MKPTTAAALGLAALLALAPLSSAFAQAAQAADAGAAAAPAAQAEAPAAQATVPADQAGAAPGADATAANAAGDEAANAAGDDQAPPDAAADDSMNPFLRGEQTIALGAGLHIPLFITPGTATDGSTNLSLGGAFSFSYQYFVARGLAIGGSIAGAFNSTIGGLSLFVAPLAFTTAYWWSLAPFEFDVGVGAGGYISRLDSDGMLGLFAKAGGGVYYRISSWSVGLESYFWFMPELHSSSYSSLDRYAGFLQVGASAVYHL